MEKLPSPHTYLLLGDAYMNIQEVSGRCDSSVSYEILFYSLKTYLCGYWQTSKGFDVASSNHIPAMCSLIPISFWSSISYIFPKVKGVMKCCPSLRDHLLIEVF